MDLTAYQNKNIYELIVLPLTAPGANEFALIVLPSTAPGAKIFAPVEKNKSHTNKSHYYINLRIIK